MRSNTKLSAQMALEAELKVKSKMLEQSISQFTEATCEIGELEKLLAYSRIDGGTTERTPYSRARPEPSQTPIHSGYPTPATNANYSTSRGPYAYRVAGGDDPSDLNWAVEESQLAQMRDEVGLYVKEESKLSMAHLQARDDLQESWDKLVKLRTHISFFYAAIEEAKIEEIATEAQGWSAATSPRAPSSGIMHPLIVETSSLDGAIAPATADDFAQISQTPMKDSVQNVDRFVGIYVLREKVQKRDYMRKAVSDAERELQLARDRVANYSDELLAMSSASSFSGGGSFSSTRGMNLRQKLLEANLELEQVEAAYLKNKDSLAEFEGELGTALLGVSEAVVTELKGMNAQSGEGAGGGDLNLSHFLEQADQMDEAVSVASSISKSGPSGPQSTGTVFSNEAGQLVHKPEARPVHTFSLQEVLSGQIRISRMNGECASSYKDRLQRRVQAIEPLVTQLKLEVETKAERARQARLDLKDAEVRRLRAELQLSNCEGIIREKKEAKNRLILTKQQEDEDPHELCLNLRTPMAHSMGGMSLLDRTRTEEKVYNRFHNQLANVEDMQTNIDIHTTSAKRSRKHAKILSPDEVQAKEKGWNISRVDTRSRSNSRARSRSPSASGHSPMRIDELAQSGGGASSSDGEGLDVRGRRSAGRKTTNSRDRDRSVDKPTPSAISKGSPTGHSKRPGEGKKASPNSRRNRYASENFTRSSELDDADETDGNEHVYNRSSDIILSADEYSDGQAEQSEGTGVSRRRHNTSGGKVPYRLRNVNSSFGSPRSRFKQPVGNGVLRSSSTSRQRSATPGRVAFADTGRRHSAQSGSPPPAPRINARSTSRERSPSSQRIGEALHEPSTKWPGSNNYGKSSDNRPSTSGDEERGRVRQVRGGGGKSKASASVSRSRSASRAKSSSVEPKQRGRAVSTVNAKKKKSEMKVEEDNVSDVLKAAEIISNQVSSALHEGTGVGSQRRFRSSRKLRVAQSGDEDESRASSRNRGDASDTSKHKRCESSHVHSDGYSSIDDNEHDAAVPAAIHPPSVQFSSPGAQSVSTIGNNSAAHTIHSYQVHNYADSPNHKYTASAVKRRTSADESMCRIMDMLNKNQESLDMLNHTQEVLKTMLATPPPKMRQNDTIGETKRRDISQSIQIVDSPAVVSTPTVNASAATKVRTQNTIASVHKKPASIVKKNPKTGKAKKEVELGSPFLKKGVTTPIVRGRPTSTTPSRVMLARKVASLHERRQSRSRTRGSPSRSRSASPTKSSPTGLDSPSKSVSLIDLEKELAEGIEVEPFEFDSRPKPFHRIQERMAHEGSTTKENGMTTVCVGESDGLGSTGGSPRSVFTSSPRARSVDGSPRSRTDSKLGDNPASVFSPAGQISSPNSDVAVPEMSLPTASDNAAKDSDESTDESDVVEEYEQKHALLKQIMSSGTQCDEDSSPSKAHTEMASVGVDTAGLNIREAGWLWSPNSRSKDKLIREKERSDRIEYYRRNRAALSPSRSPSPSRIALLNKQASAGNDKGGSLPKNSNGPKSRNKKHMANYRSSVSAANVASVNVTTANVKSHILVEQKKLEKCIIKLTNMKDMREKHKSRLRELKTKKRMEKQQLQGSNETITDRSTVALKVTVLSARNLPEMKRQKHSADPYVELWVKSSPGNDDDGNSQIVDGVTMQRYSTTIKWGMLFPLWEESFDFTLPCDLNNEAENNFNSSLDDDMSVRNHRQRNHASGGKVAISDDCVRIVLRDAVKSDIATNEAANVQSIIGECFLNFGSLLDQKVHTFWLPVVDTVVATPELQHLYRSRHKIPADCALKVEARLMYSKEILLRNRISELDKQISKLSTFVDTCSSELLELAYEWEEMQQKQSRLKSLTAQPQKETQKSAPAARKTKKVHPYAAPQTSKPLSNPVSFESFMFGDENRIDIPKKEAESYHGGIDGGDSPVVSLERREGEDLLLLARSNSKMEIGDNDKIIKVSDKGFTSAEDKTNIVDDKEDGVASNLQTDFGDSAELEPKRQRKNLPVSFDDFIANKDRPREETVDTSERENETVPDNGDRSDAVEQSNDESTSISRAPNMSIFRGAGGGRNPPKQISRAAKPVQSNKKRWL